MIARSHSGDLVFPVLIALILFAASPRTLSNGPAGSNDSPLSATGGLPIPETGFSQADARYISVYERFAVRDAEGEEPWTKVYPILAQEPPGSESRQSTKVWIFFEDKGIRTVRAYEAALAELACRYSARAVERRVKRRSRPGLFDEFDLPVARDYIAAVEATGARVHIVSKWLNAVSAYATRAQIEQISRHGFVRGIQPVRRARRIEPVMERQIVNRKESDPGMKEVMGSGDTCASATLIPNIPYSDSGETLTAGDDYEEECPWISIGSPDVVYSYTPTDDVTVDIQLCNGADYYTTLYVYENVCPDGGPFACGEDCTSPEWSHGAVTFNLTLTAGSTYYIVVDGTDHSAGNYVLDVSESTVYGRSSDQLTEINLPALHDFGFTGTGVVIGVLDSGFVTTHEAFTDPAHPLDVVAAWDFVDGDPDPGPGVHGTEVLSTIGAYMPDKMIGGAYDASFILCRTEDTSAEYQAEEDNYVAALEFVEANGGDMVTSSLNYLAFDDPDDSYSQEDLDGLTAVCTIGTNIATANGVHCVNSVGNGGHDTDPATSQVGAPADAFDVISVGAVYGTGGITDFSSDGPTADGRVKPEVLARGYNTRVVDADNDTGYTDSAGTSFAAPLVASAVACLIEAHPDWTVEEMRQALVQTADYYVAHGTHDPLYVRGYGIIDAFAAAQLDCNNNGITDSEDIADLNSTDCNADGTPDECEIDEDSTAPSGPFYCPSDCDPDCNDNGIPDECDLDPLDPDGDGQISDNCNYNAVPDECEPDEDCNTNGIRDICDIGAGTSPDGNGNWVPDECDPLVPPSLPAAQQHQVRKNRYISIDPHVNGANVVGYKVELVEMLRCAGDLRRACSLDQDCPLLCDNDPNRYCVTDAACGGGTCASTAPCVHHPDEGLTWWILQPQQNPLGCRLPGGCTDEDWFARLGALPHFRAWHDFGDTDSSLLHVSDCEVTPAAVYAVSACLPPAGEACSDPLIIGTILRPNAGSYGDVVGIVDPATMEFTPPNKILNVTDVMGYMLTNANYGLPGNPKPQAHWTWIDMEGLGAPHYAPQAILNITDLNQIMFGTMGQPFSQAGNNVDPGDCP
ncbi:MAG: S8 family serine peptidase [Phycisphaerales bacterium]|nr:MAG: S8 family serine peptidase [Phycisphaerales bacterium]